MSVPLMPANEIASHAAHESSGPAAHAGALPASRTPRSRRTPYRVPCRVRLVDVATGEVRAVVGETLNISAGGLAVQLPTEVPIGTWVETLVLQPTGDPMFLSGHVIHTRRTLASNFEIGVTMQVEKHRAFI